MLVPAADRKLHLRIDLIEPARAGQRQHLLLLILELRDRSVDVDCPAQRPGIALECAGEIVRIRACR